MSQLGRESSSTSGIKRQILSTIGRREGPRRNDSVTLTARSDGVALFGRRPIYRSFHMVLYLAAAAVALAVCFVLTAPGSAREQRSASVKREFQLTYPCPTTGRTSGACLGLRQGPRQSAQVRWPRRGQQHAVADDG
jgi:hypothetical protein